MPPHHLFNVEHVESVERADLSSYFSTLSKKLKALYAEEINAPRLIHAPGLESFPRFPRVPREKITNPAMFLNIDKKKLTLVFDWLRIACSEGHVDPSQPSVGKIVGWPRRKFSKESIYVDLLAWCHKQNVDKRYTPNRELAFLIFDDIFVADGNKYAFPELSLCRNKLLLLVETYELN